MTKPGPGIASAKSLAGLLLSLLVSAIILAHFYDHFWYPPDEGIYAHVADRLLRGEILNLDVQEIHFGHISFINAFWLYLFGHDLISLRYPLVVISLLQAGLVYCLFASRGVLVAVSASVSLTSLSFVQFLNPSAHWYCLFLVIVIIMVANRWPHGRRWRLETIGFLAVTLLFFRQLSGVFAGMGLLTYLLCESRENARGTRLILARSLILVMAALIVWYLSRLSDPLTFLIFGLWPLGVLAWAFINTTVSNSSVLQMTGRVCIGGVIAATPVLLYHLVNGSFSVWYKDTVLVALTLSDMDFTRMSHYASYLGYAILEISKLNNATAIVNGLYWVVMILLTMANGFLLLMALRNHETQQTAIHPLPFLAIFYSLVSLHFQIPVYLYFTIGLTLVAFLWLTTAGNGWRKSTPIILTCSVSIVGLYYHASQPLSRGAQGILAGEKATAMLQSPLLDESSLKIEANEAALYARLIALIQQETTPSDSILAIPANPELYFLSRRRNLLRFSNTALGMIDTHDLQLAIKQIIEEPPALVVYRSDDKYQTSYTLKLMEFIRHNYDRIDTIGGFEIYRYSDVKNN